MQVPVFPRFKMASKLIFYKYLTQIIVAVALLTLPASTGLATITIRLDFSCQTICQKSLTVFCRVPKWQSISKKRRLDIVICIIRNAECRASHISYIVGIEQPRCSSYIT